MFMDNDSFGRIAKKWEKEKEEKKYAWNTL